MSYWTVHSVTCSRKNLFFPAGDLDAVLDAALAPIIRCVNRLKLFPLPVYTPRDARPQRLHGEAEQQELYDKDRYRGEVCEALRARQQEDQRLYR